MDKLLVLEASYETIKDSMDWEIDCEDKTFANYVDAVINMTHTLLKKLDNVKCDKGG